MVYVDTIDEKEVCVAVDVVETPEADCDLDDREEADGLAKLTVGS